MSRGAQAGIRRGYLDYPQASAPGQRGGNCSGQLHYYYCGSPSAPLLLLLHQTPSSAEMYLRLMPLLADHFFVLAVDTPGFGHSDPLDGPVSIAGFADAIYRGVSAQFERPALVFGHHTGAAIAVQLAFDQPQFVRALALSGPTLLNEAQKKALPLSVQGIPMDPEGAFLHGMWCRLRSKDPDAALSLSLRETLLAFTCDDYYQASYRAVVEQDVATQMSAIECPTLVFAGGRDVLKPAVEPSLQLLKRGTKAELPEEAGTYVCDRQPEVVAEALRDFFLAQVTGAGQHQVVPAEG